METWIPKINFFLQNFIYVQIHSSIGYKTKWMIRNNTKNKINGPFFIYIYFRLTISSSVDYFYSGLLTDDSVNKANYTVVSLCNGNIHSFNKIHFKIRKCLKLFWFELDLLNSTCTDRLAQLRSNNLKVNKLQSIKAVIQA